MRILLFATAYNGMCQRMDRELRGDGHSVRVAVVSSGAEMFEAAEDFNPHLIVCPFLKARIPDELWQRHICLIVHPGIEGDRGPSSIDWAIHDRESHWGVTLLQADTEMDAGDIWGTCEFPLRDAGKASTYRREVTGGAVRLVREALQHLRDFNFCPRPLDPEHPEVRGRLRPSLPQRDRAIDWDGDGHATIVRKIHAADSAPGVLAELHGRHVYLYGATSAEADTDGFHPGEVMAFREGGACVAARDGVVWIRQMKAAGEVPAIKLPAERLLSDAVTRRPRPTGALAEAIQGFSELDVRIDDGIAWVEFDFYNGAMNTLQCRRLLGVLERLDADDSVDVVVLLGGEEFFSNGIHLNVIEAADDPALESWRNINAVNDVVARVLTMDGKLTVAGLRANAGAGGAILPLACDRVFARDGVVLNPHYANMGLYGSEYWTYVLPRRIGQSHANAVISACEPMLTREAFSLGMIDELGPEEWSAWHDQLHSYCQELRRSGRLRRLLKAKARQRERDERAKPLADYRAQELKRMKAIFDDPGADYHRLRRAFVLKTPSAEPAAAIGREPARRVARTA